MSFLEQLHLVIFPNKVVSELGCLEFFLCAKMDNGMIKLNSMNYSTLKRMMEDLLYCKDLYKSIQLKEKPSNTLDDDWDVEHRKAITYMRRWMDPTLHEHISDETKVDVWKKLENIFARKTSGNKTTLIKRLVNLKYKDGNNMVEHINYFQGIMNKLVAMKMNIDDEMQASLLLSALPDSWETLVVTVSNSTPNGILTMECVKDTLLNEEARRKEKGESSFEVLVHEKQERQKKPERHERSQSRNSHGFRGRSKSRKYIKCYPCNKVGHMRKECMIWKKEQNDLKKENKETNAIFVESDIMIVTDDSCVNLAT